MALQQLRTFIEVYRRRSISGAARTLGMTQPGVSQHIAAIEAQLGRPLFERHARGVRPTPVADDLAASLGSSLDDAEASLSSLRARTEEMTGTIHLAGPADYMTERVAPRLLPLIQAGLSLRLQFGGREQLYAMLLEDRVDIAITASRPDDPRLAFRSIGAEVLKAVAAPEFAARINAAADLASELTGTTDLAYDLDRPMTRAWLTLNDLPALIAPPIVAAPDLGLMRSMVAHGAGWAVLPDFLVDGLLQSGVLQEIMPPVGRPSSQFFLVWAHSTMRQPRMVYARDALLRELAGEAVTGRSS